MVLHDEVASFDEIDAHLCRQEDVLEVRRVEHARREDDDVGAGTGGRRGGRLQCREQEIAVVRDGSDPAVVEQLGEQPSHGLTVLDDIADTAWRTEIVLQDAIGAIDVTNEVDPRHQAAGAGRYHDPDRLRAVALGAHDQAARDDPVVDDLCSAGVDVVEERIECSSPLDQAELDRGPLVAGNDPRHEVHREGPFHSLLIAVDGERDALPKELRVDLADGPVQIAGRKLSEAIEELLVMGPGRSGLVDGLVEEALVLVASCQVHQGFHVLSSQLTVEPQSKWR